MSKNSARSLAGSVRQLLRTWWLQDRIRVGRTCGQLLTLDVGSRLVIDDQVWIVMNRVEMNAHGQSREVATYWEPLSDSADLKTLNDRKQHAIRTIDQSALADGSGISCELAYSRGPLTEVAGDDVPTHVAYLLCAAFDGLDGAHNAWEVEGSAAADEKVLCQVARLIVPIAAQEIVRFARENSESEILADEILIVPH